MPGSRRTTPTTTTSASHEALIDYHRTYLPDTRVSTVTIVPGRVLDLLDYKMYDWPGHGTGDDASYQYNEAEYMMPDEYPLSSPIRRRTGRGTTFRVRSERSSRCASSLR